MTHVPSHSLQETCFCPHPQETTQCNAQHMQVSFPMLLPGLFVVSDHLLILKTLSSAGWKDLTLWFYSSFLDIPHILMLDPSPPHNH